MPSCTVCFTLSHRYDDADDYEDDYEEEQVDDDDDDEKKQDDGVYVQLHGLFHAVSPPPVCLKAYLWTNIHSILCDDDDIDIYLHLDKYLYGHVHDNEKEEDDGDDDTDVDEQCPTVNILYSGCFPLDMAFYLYLFCHFVFLSYWFSVFLSFFLSSGFSVFLFFPSFLSFLSFFLSFLLSICHSVFLSFWVSVILSFYLSVSLSVFRNFCLSVFLSFDISVFLPFCLSFYLFVIISFCFYRTQVSLGSDLWVMIVTAAFYMPNVRSSSYPFKVYRCSCVTFRKHHPCNAHTIPLLWSLFEILSLMA